MVEVPDGRVAVRGPAGVVAGLDEAPQPGREKPGPGIDGDEFSGSRSGEEAPEPELEFLLAFGFAWFGIALVPGAE
ncbi:hypothetical protein AHiyo8_46120 [Arthrobacter sp. Hiyo8]|nr:hypothetical protein AHiyo8_46120 [Arthrobacter sp. Hiyo8]